MSSNITSPTELLRATPRGSLLLDKESKGSLTVREKLELTLLKAAYVKLYAQNQILKEVTKQISILQVKKNNSPNKTLLPEEESMLTGFMAKLTEVTSAINSIQSSSISDIEAQRTEARKALLEKLQNNSPTLATPNTDDLFQYIIRTEVLNPYQRHRQCDENFLSLLNLLALETTGKRKEYEKQAKELLS